MYIKSQAALEFLTTYVWAILIIFIVLGVLAYFGVFKPSKILPDRCSLSPDIVCIEFKIGQTDAGTGILRLRLKNNLAEPITVTSWDTTSESKTPFSCTLKPNTGIWPSQEIRDVEFTDCNIKEAGLVLGEKGKVDVRISYYPTRLSGVFSQSVEGEIFAAVTNVEGLLTQPNCSDSTDNDQNGCIDYAGGDTGCSSPSDITESGGICPNAGGAGLSLYCFVSTLCNDIAVFRMSALQDAHAEIPSLSNYDYKVCCRASNDTLSNSCTSPQAIPLHLSTSTDAHAEKNTFANYNVNVCLSASIKAISCNYAASCLADETCLAAISADTDAHVGDCVTQPFANKVCCRIG